MGMLIATASDPEPPDRSPAADAGPSGRRPAADRTPARGRTHSHGRTPEKNSAPERDGTPERGSTPDHEYTPEGRPQQYGAPARHGRSAADRTPKQDRSRATRQRILQAAVACLAERGWSGSTVGVVCARAGVSRGAAQHHFRTREELFTAAIAHMAEQWLDSVRERARALPPAGPDRTYAVVDLLVAVHTGPLFRAALHLWVAAGEEEALRPRVAALEARIGREAHRVAVDFLGADESRPGVRATVQATLDMARGLGLANLLTDDSARRAGIVRQWARLLDAVLHDPPDA